MKKNILIINSKPNLSEWNEYLASLERSGYNLSLLSCDPKLITISRTKQWDYKNFHPFFEPDRRPLSAWIFLLLSPFLFFYAFCQLIYFKFSKKINVILSFANYEKIHFTRAARLLGIKVIWIMEPDSHLRLSRLNRFRLARLSRLSTVACLSKACLDSLASKKHTFKNLNHLKIGLSSERYQEQKNIFDSLAKNNASEIKNKFFTIGTIQDLDKNTSHLEKLFQAIKKCTEVIPEIQLIIAGDGPGRKRLSWIARKMGISNLIWFVGNHKNPQKWLVSFDLYVSTSPIPSFSLLNTMLLALSDSLPVIAPEDKGFEEFIKDKESGILLDIDDTEALARSIIELQQNSFKRKNIGQKGQIHAHENFRLENSIAILKSIIEE